MAKLNQKVASATTSNPRCSTKIVALTPPRARPIWSGRETTPLPPLLFELHVQPQTPDLVGEYVEAGGRAGFQRVLALDHRLVDLGPAFHVVRLYRQKLLQDVGRPVRLQRPD